MLSHKNFKNTNEATDIDADLITVDNFFAHFGKEITITKYGSNKELIPTFSPYEIYQYSDAMLKYLPKDALKKIEKALLYSNKPVYFNDVNMKRRNHTDAGLTTTGLNATQIVTLKENYTKDLNIDDGISRFREILKNEHVYRIPLRYFTGLGKINFPTKIDYRIKLHLETEMKKLFESRKVLVAGTAIPAPDAKIIFAKASFIQYEQILLDKNFRQYLETIMVSKKILRMGAQKAPIQKTYERNVGQDSLNINFLGANRQFDGIELSLVYDKSDKHTTMYDSYNVEMGSKKIKSVRLTNFTEIYSLIIEKKEDLCRFGTSKIKNKNIHRALNSDLANYVVTETQNEAKNS